MKTLDISESIAEAMEYIEGDSLESKLFQLLASDLKNRLQRCSERIVEYEAKYGYEFPEFKQAWEDGKIDSPGSHEIESDFMEWESLVEERKFLLSQLKKMSEKGPASN
ncbi:hypothetical protein K9M06_05285 [Candidatus Bipolaricaulota bacterium]|nr:hypothetical protein [Candidatus Bipolaricaulota bacterium]